MKYNITIDWDIPFNERVKYESYKNLIQFLKQNKIKYFYERHSSRNNTHIKFNMKVKDLLDVFCIRALLRDDKNRILIDLMRHYNNMDINRLWDSKFKNGVLYKAGEWCKIKV